MNNWLRKNILITGGSSGMGLALSKKILPFVQNLIIFDQKKLKLSLISTNKMHIKKVHFIKGCISRTSDINNMVKYIGSKNIQSIDILINNAGFAYYKHFNDMSLKEIKLHADVNFLGFLKVTKLCLPFMMKPGKRRKFIINNASIASEITITPNSVYGGAKAGMLHFSKLLNFELNAYDVHVKTILPGRVETSFFDHISYKKRSYTPESKMITKIEDVINIIYNSLDSNKIVFYAPKYWGLVSYFLKTNFFNVKKLLDIVIVKRVNRSIKKL